MRIAHLLMVHAFPEQTERLVARLAHPNADFYIHVDAKSDIEKFARLRDMENVFFVSKRVKVWWAAWSQVEATLNGFREIASSGREYDFVNFLTAQDYPLKSIEEIHLFLAGNKGTAFMHALPVETEWQEALPRFTRYHLIEFQFRYRYKIQRFLNRILPARRLPAGLVPMGRSAYFTIPLEHVKYVLEYMDRHPSVRRFFLFTWGPDEFIFQTILCSSPFGKQVVNDNLRYIDWSGGGANPKVLSLEDAPVLMKSGKLFARKFSMNNPDILDWLDKEAGYEASESRVNADAASQPRA
ncbi:MAG: beta-1,6-N-acetylglucosaminyltransferase [Bacteroidota bacterium]